MKFFITEKKNPYHLQPNSKILANGTFHVHVPTSMQTDSPNLTPKKSPTESPHSTTPETPRPHTDTGPGMVVPGDERQPPMAVPGVDSHQPVAPSGSDGQPAPRDVAPKELQVLQSCLTRWRTEVENDVKGELI